MECLECSKQLYRMSKIAECDQPDILECEINIEVNTSLGWKFESGRLILHRFYL